MSSHAGAMALAAEANEQVFGPLRNIMEWSDTDRAREALLAQLELVAQMIAQMIAVAPAVVRHRARGRLEHAPAALRLNSARGRAAPAPRPQR